MEVAPAPDKLLCSIQDAGLICVLNVFLRTSALGVGLDAQAASLPGQMPVKEHRLQRAGYQARFHVFQHCFDNI